MFSVSVADTPSHAVAVGQFELALAWPVFIQARKQPIGEGRSTSVVDARCDPEDPHFLDGWVRSLVTPTEGTSSPWQEVASTYPPLHGPEAEPGYAEFVYFHPMIRHFLYANRDDIRARHAEKLAGQQSLSTSEIEESRNRNLRILERNDLAELVVEYEMQPTLSARGGYQQLRTTFLIKPCWLYLFDTQAAMLELKLRHVKTEVLSDEQQPLRTIDLNLRIVLRLQDIVRRVYAPYWSVFPNDGGKANEWRHQAGHCPRRLELRFADTSRQPLVSTFGNFIATAASIGEVCEPTEAGPVDASYRAHREKVFRDREPYTETVFHELLRPILPVETQASENATHSLVYEQIEDERIPAFSYVAVDDPRKITTGDWLRLAALDDEGDSLTWPYSPEFIGPDPLANFAYDRYWHSTGERPAQEELHRTRWLCSGYGFVGVGPYDPRAIDDRAKEFYSNPHSGALAHYRHHYFALGLIAQFQRASLLRFKHALAEAAQTNRNGNDRSAHDKSFHEQTQRLMRDFLRFRTLYWFSEVSNQIQGRELFELFSRHLRLQSLFAEVTADLESAAAVLRAREEDEQTKAQQMLGMLGASFLVLTPVLDLLVGELSWSLRFCAAFLLFLVLGRLVLFLIGKQLTDCLDQLSDGKPEIRTLRLRWDSIDQRFGKWNLWWIGVVLSSVFFLALWLWSDSENVSPTVETSALGIPVRETELRPPAGQPPRPRAGAIPASTAGVPN